MVTKKQFLYVCENDKEDIVKEYIESGKDLNISYIYFFGFGKTALMGASRNGNEKIVKMLIEAGADLNIQNTDGWTALMIASNYSNEDSSENTVKMLIEAGADLNLQSKYGNKASDYYPSINNYIKMNYLMFYIKKNYENNYLQLSQTKSWNIILKYIKLF